MFKKLAVTIISLTILITCIYPINALEINADLTIDTEVVDDAVIEEEKIICNATIDQNFKDDSVMVVFKKEINSYKNEFTINDFKDVDVKSVKNIMGFSKNNNVSQLVSIGSNYKESSKDTWFNKNPNKIIKITLKNKGKANVLNAIKVLEKRDDIVCAEPNYIYKINATVSNDSYRRSQWGLNKIDINNAWDFTTGSSTVTVGVLDSGIDGNHPDLTNRIDRSLCRDFTSGSEVIVSNPTDSYGHGTHVAGIIGAQGNNGIGVTGVCWDVKLASIRVLDNNGLGYNDHIASAIEYAQQNQIPIINCSFGGYIYSGAMKTAIDNYSGLVICSAGNEINDNDVNPHYPSDYNCPNIISVAATKSNDQLPAVADWRYDEYGNPQGSNYGDETVDIAAPGDSIYSTVPNSDYSYESGTSMAAPYVTGVAALIKSINPNFTNEQIRGFILNGASQPSTLNGLIQDSRRLNAYGSLKRAMEFLMSKAEKSVSGDFNGDGKDDLAYFVEYGANYMQILVSISNGNGFEPPKLWLTNQGYDLAKIGDRIGAGDINNDGKDVIFTMYDYGDGTCKIHTFKSTGSSFTGWHLGWEETHTGWYYTSSVGNRFVVGDFNGDGYDDAASMYNYGNNTVQIHIFYSNGNTLNSMVSAINETSYNSGDVYGLTAGNIRGDAKDDIIALYDYNGYSGYEPYSIAYHCFWFNGSAMQLSWQHVSTLYPTSNIIGMFAGGFNGDNYVDLGTLYNYGFVDNTYRVTIHGVLSDDWNSMRWLHTENSYDGNCVRGRVNSGDFDGDGYDDVSAMYNYTNDSLAVHVFKSNGSTIPSVNWWYGF